MMLQLNVEETTRKIQTCNDFLTAGRLRSAQGVLTANISAAVGELCHIRSDRSEPILAEVIGFRDNACQLMPFYNTEGLKAGQDVVGLNRRLTIPVGAAMLGRVVDALGSPIDGKGMIKTSRRIPVMTRSVNPMERPPISEPIHTGQKVIDGLLTMGRGQRIGLFAGSGVGKSSLLGELARNSSEEINVVALVGERGRELRPFIEESLGPSGLQRSIVIAATVEQPALVRVRAAQTALAVANWFRNQGKNVMLMLDSLTRMVVAQREIGLLLNEPPTSRGFPPSSFQLLSTIVEQMGNTREGSITGILTVLVDGDDTNEPVSDAARSVLDGHIMLGRTLAQKNHFPAIDVSKSISRITRTVCPPEQIQNAGALRAILATYNEVEDLIRIGSYQAGTSPAVDLAVKLKPHVDAFLKQELESPSSYAETNKRMQVIAQEWRQFNGDLP